MTPTGSFMENVISSFQTGFRQLLMTFVFAVCRFQWKERKERKKWLSGLTEETLYLLRNDN